MSEKKTSRSLKAHVREYGARPKRSLGQVFLIEPTIRRKILDLAELHPQDCVVEIGPGPGALTRDILGRVRTLIALEIDPDLTGYLRRSLPGDRSFLLVRTDALTFDYGRAAKKLGSPLKLVGNIPYGISAPLLFTCVRDWQAFSKILLMVQKEVAQRLTASPGNKNYGVLTVLCGIRFTIRVRQKVPRQCFSPVPRVDSAVVECLPRHEVRLAPREEEIFRLVVKAAFSMRRKTLFNALRLSGQIEMGDDRLREILREVSVSPDRRPETLSAETFLQIALCILGASDAQ